MTPEPAAALALEGMSKRFGTVQALTNVSVHIRPGTVHALLGENGAGKTTLMRLAYGLVRPDAGIVRIRGTARHITTPRDALAHGVGMVQQHFSLVPGMTVAENVALGGRGRLNRRAAADRVRELAGRTGLAADPDRMVADLPVGAQQRVEILKALSHDVGILVLDEPTAVLAPAEASVLLRWVREFASDERAVVLITHKLRDALAVADDVTVLRHGRVVLSTAVAMLDEDAIATAMLGDRTRTVELRRDSADVAVGSAANRIPPVVARIAGATVHGRGGRPALRGVTVEVRAGEILGVAAVEGNGERELLRVLAGRLELDAGTAALPPHIGFVPQDRHADGLADTLTLTENIALRGAGERRGWLSWRDWRNRTSELMVRFDVRAPSPDEPVRHLSGGNQQRLVLARELEQSPQLLVADQPTRGLDVRATAEVHARLRAARDEGVAVVVHSADLDEVLSLATRVVVVLAGEVREIAGDRDEIGRAMLGVAG